MKLRRLFILCLILVLPVISDAQAIDNTLSYKNINNDSYFRINYENDFFSSTDKYYTQGLHLELVAPWVKRFPISKLLVQPNWGYIRYGIGAEHDAYTPTSISDPHILHGDRPFTAALFLKTFLIAIDTVHGQRFSSAISTGVIGQAAGGMEMQTAIHRWLGDITPHGWPNQIHNDAVLNYQADYEKRVVGLSHYFCMDMDGMARVGTLSDKAAIGTTVMFGYLPSPYTAGATRKNNFRIYAYEHAAFNAVAYDATLEGGVFNHTSPYTISASNVTPVVFENRFGFVVVYRRIDLEYFQSLLSREFTTGNYHVWGGVQIAFAL